MLPPVTRLVLPRRGFSTARSLQQVRIYTPVRNTGDFHTALRTSTTANTPLITLFTASYCPSCRVVKAALEKHFKERGDAAPDLQYAEVELDAQGGGVEELGSRYMVCSSLREAAALLLPRLARIARLRADARGYTDTLPAYASPFPSRRTRE
jgi:hypothetical protein